MEVASAISRALILVGIISSTCHGWDRYGGHSYGGFAGHGHGGYLGHGYGGYGGHGHGSYLGNAYNGYGIHRHDGYNSFSYSPYGYQPYGYGGYGFDPYGHHHGHHHDDCEDVELSPVCKMAKEAGTGSDSLIQWYFDKDAERCKGFIYTGSGGNDNRFDTEEGCKLFCQSKTCKKKSKHARLRYGYNRHLHATKHKIDAYLAHKYLLGKRKLSVQVDYLNTPLEWQYLNQHHGLQHPLAYTQIGQQFGLGYNLNGAAPQTQAYTQQAYTPQPTYQPQTYAQPQIYSQTQTYSQQPQSYAQPQTQTYSPQPDSQAYSQTQVYEPQQTYPQSQSYQTFSQQGIYVDPSTYGQAATQGTYQSPTYVQQQAIGQDLDRATGGINTEY